MRTENKTNHKRMSFRFFIYLLMVNALGFYFTFKYANQYSTNPGFEDKMGMINIVGNIILVIGCFFTLLSIKNKEEKDYQYYISIIGYPVMILFALARLLF